MSKFANSSPQIVIISPARDEERTLERTLKSMLAQTLRPALWVIVDDGSTDRTAAIVQQYANSHDWIRLVTRGDRGFRKVGGGVIEAFDEGLASVTIPYDFLAKMDVDLEFSPDYLQQLMVKFLEDPKLAAASGKVFRPEGEGFVEEFMIDEMVAGQFKLYRRESFEIIGGFVREVMWDGIDFHRCRMEGFHTRSFPEEGLRLIHLRLMGSSDKSVYTGRLRWGRGQWFMGSAFPYVLASGLRRAAEKPYIVGGALIVAGYLKSALKGERRYEFPGFREDLRSWQYGRLKNLFMGRGAD